MPVYTKKNGYVYCVYCVGKKRVWEPFGKGPEAVKAAQLRDLEIKAKKIRGISSGSGTTFNELAQAYVNARFPELAKKTCQGIMLALTDWAYPQIGRKPLSIINIQDWIEIQNKMIESKLSASTINKYFHYISKVFTWAARTQIIQDNPWRHRERLKSREKFKIDLFTIDEFRKILENAPDHLAWVMETAYYTGCRPGPSELFSLKWSDVDWKRRAIRIYAPKTDSWRTQFIPREFLRRMRQRYVDQQKNYPDCPFICHFEGKPIGKLRRSWITAKKNADIDRRIRLYDIRHFHITYALANGADIMELATRVGHVNADMIARVYAHLAKDIRMETAHKLPKIALRKQNCRPTVDHKGLSNKKGLRE